jgi:cytochrome c biogenesis protein CcmG, thiol:disulfide interchange protein DsbE
MNQPTKLPSAVVTSLENKPIDIATLPNGGRPIVIVFFDTSCKPCLAELNVIADTYEDWMDETGVKLVAIALDDEKNVAKVEVYVRAKEWSYEVYLDTDQKLASALAITIRPTTVIIDREKNIVWRQSGFQPGDENTILEKVRVIAAN